MIYNIKLSNGDKGEVIEYILKKNQKVNGWSSPYIDAVVDFNDLEKIIQI